MIRDIGPSGPCLAPGVPGRQEHVANNAMSSGLGHESDTQPMNVSTRFPAAAGSVRPSTVSVPPRLHTGQPPGIRAARP